MSTQVQSEGRRLLSIKEIAEAASLSKKFIKKQIREGRLPAVRLAHSCVRIEQADWDTFIASKKEGSQ